MFQQDNLADPKVSLSVAALTADADGTAIDTANWIGSILGVLSSAAASAGDTLDIVIQESADGSTNWAAIPADALFDPATGSADTYDQVTDAATAAEKFQVKAIRKERVKRYLRAVADVGGASISIAATFIFIGQKKYANFSN